MTKIDERRARLEALAGTLPIIREVIEELDGLQAQVRQLEGNLNGARTSRDTWRERARKAERAVGKYKEQLKAERELARMLPRYEDGRPMRIGDRVSFNGGESEITSITFVGYESFVYVKWCGKPNGKSLFPFEVKRPPLRAADGQPIEIGQTLYGEDGKVWVISGFFHGEKYPIEGCTPDENGIDIVKRLKPEWLTHEKLRTLQDVIHDIALNSVEVKRYAKNFSPILGINDGQLADEIEKHADELRECMKEWDSNA